MTFLLAAWKKNQPSLVTVKYCYLLKNVGKKITCHVSFQQEFYSTKKTSFLFQICQPDFLWKILPSTCSYIFNKQACLLILFKIYFPLIVLFLGQKSCFLGPTIFDIPQPNRYILKSVPLNFVVNTVLYYYCVYYEI